jgi:hypothetical protein
VNAVALDGNGLVAVIVLTLAAVVVIVVLTRMVARDRQIRVSRVGWFVERERFVGNADPADAAADAAEGEDPT